MAPPPFWILIFLSVFASTTSVTYAQEHPGVPYCPDVYGLAVHPHPEFCYKFYKCENGTLTLETCENGLLFDGKGAIHNHCNYNWAVNCDKRINDIPPISSDKCEYQFGIYPTYPGRCDTSYLKCAYGVPYVTPCDAGLAYDEKNHVCNWPDLLLDTCDPELVVGFKCPDKVEPKSPAYKFWPFPRYSLGDCHRLVTCVNGYPRLITCGYGSVFNDASLTCEDPADVRTECGKIKF